MHHADRAAEIPSSSTKDELHRYARGEFERNRNVTDLTGKSEFDMMRRYIDEQVVG
ncbi:triglyceride lipase-cholesterol esterase [Aspergillus luchuensis]|uniref:Triglyceride lipase-cholesterol esterase n=1 Tax=Aspergillus kawachii TaxID=1069201 RepID=A0A146FKI5_ASPKA|nr:triglyceride lipase-cholesterol esterase [Aspergillus luchuensis]